MLATMAAAVEDLRPVQARSEGQRDLAELRQIRDALLKDRVATTNRGKRLRTPVSEQLNKQWLKQIERQLKAHRRRDSVAALEPTNSLPLHLKYLILDLQHLPNACSQFPPLPLQSQKCSTPLFGTLALELPCVKHTGADH